VDRCIRVVHVGPDGLLALQPPHELADAGDGGLHPEGFLVDWPLGDPVEEGEAVGLLEEPHVVLEGLFGPHVGLVPRLEEGPEVLAGHPDGGDPLDQAVPLDDGLLLLQEDVWDESEESGDTLQMNEWSRQVRIHNETGIPQLLAHVVLLVPVKEWRVYHT
jgi:hypothetical protein